jgi:hypothetical protein
MLGSMRREHVILAAALTGLACQSGSSFPPALLSFNDFCPRWRAAVGAAYERCTEIPAAALNLDACARDEASYVAGRVTFNEGGAAVCVHEWETASCAAVLAQDLPGCQNLEAGLVTAGGACSSDAECVGSLICNKAGKPACAGVCRAHFALADECSTNPNGCFADASCVTTGAMSICQARAAVGGACGPGVADCAQGLVCVAGTSGTSASTCLARSALGDPCLPPAAPCAGYAVCKGGLCVLKPPAGQPCGDGTGVSDCLAAWCDAAPGASGSCQALLPSGAPCARDEQCAGNLLCTNQACAAPACLPLP